MIACLLCNDEGYIEDPVAQQTIACPICRYSEAKEQAENAGLPRWVSSRWGRMPARFYGPRFQYPPWLIVIHSGATSDNVAEYIAAPGDGRYVSAHISWSRRERMYVQQVPLCNVAWHCGGSRFRGNSKLNYCSIGIELPGPWDKERSQEEHESVRQTVIYLQEQLPSLAVVVPHSGIDRSRKDPGPGFDPSCLADLGLELAQWPF
jgi:N-acetyl-anhydromuramyl-L-alanine amidase AmpD